MTERKGVERYPRERDEKHPQGVSSNPPSSFSALFLTPCYDCDAGWTLSNHTRHHRPVHEILHVENEARLGNATRVNATRKNRRMGGKINWRFSTVDPQREDRWEEVNLLRYRRKKSNIYRFLGGENVSRRNDRSKTMLSRGPRTCAENEGEYV